MSRPMKNENKKGGEKKDSSVLKSNKDDCDLLSTKDPNEIYPRAMNIYRDIEGKTISKVEAKHLYFPCWKKSRIDPKACLPIFYATGTRFIKLEMEKPLNFKCKSFPMDLKEAREMQNVLEICEKAAEDNKNEKKGKK